MLAKKSNGEKISSIKRCDMYECLTHHLPGYSAFTEYFPATCPRTTVTLFLFAAIYFHIFILAAIFFCGSVKQ